MVGAISVCTYYAPRCACCALVCTRKVLISARCVLTRAEIDYYLWPAVNWPQSTAAATAATAQLRKTIPIISLTYR